MFVEVELKYDQVAEVVATQVSIPEQINFLHLYLIHLREKLLEDEGVLEEFLKDSRGMLGVNSINLLHAILDKQP